MNKPVNLEKIKNIIAASAALDKKELTGKSIIEEIGIDSLDVIELIMAIEEEFNITIPDEDVENLKSVKEVCDYVNKKILQPV